MVVGFATFALATEPINFDNPVIAAGTKLDCTGVVGCTAGKIAVVGAKLPNVTEKQNAYESTVRTYYSTLINPRFGTTGNQYWVYQSPFYSSSTWFIIRHNWEITIVDGVLDPVCDPPNALNPSGQCVPCPSGQFSVPGGQCLPHCDFSHAYVPGEIYNPPTGTCVQPACGAGQTADAEGRCQPNCPEGQKIDTVTGSCVLDCAFGYSLVNGQCVSDCPPGSMMDGETGSCITDHGCLSGEEIVLGTCRPECLDGETRDFKTGACLSPSPNCPFGQHKDESGKCVPSIVYCPTGTSWNESLHNCTVTPVQETKEKTITNNPDGTVTTINNTTTTIDNGVGGTSTSTVSSSTTVNSSTGEESTETTYTPPSIEKYESPEHQLNWTGWNSQIHRMSTEGPVKLLDHVKEIAQWFDVTPEAPKFTGSIGGKEFNVDLSAFDGIAQVCRFFFSCLMTVGVFWFGFRLFGLL